MSLGEGSRIRAKRRTERARAGVEIGRRGGPGGGQQAGVDHGRQALDTGILDGNDEGRLGGARGEDEIRVVRRDEEADDGGTADVEQEDTDVDALDRLREIPARVLCLAGGDLSTRNGRA